MLARTLLLAVISSALVAGCFDAAPEEAELAVLKAQGQTLIEQIEAYRARHGQYPGNLAAAGIALPKAKYGGWKYDPYSDESEFTLEIGDHSAHQWTLYWDSSGDSWILSA